MLAIYCPPTEGNHTSRVMRKPFFLHMRKQSRRSVCALTRRTTDQRLSFRYRDSKIPLLPKATMPSLWSSSSAAQPGLYCSWS